jgi:hypothetical protein
VHVFSAVRTKQLAGAAENGVADRVTLPTAGENMARGRGVEGYDGGVDEAQGGLSGLAAGAHADVLPLGTSPTSRGQYGPNCDTESAVTATRIVYGDVPTNLPVDRLTDSVQSSSMPFHTCQRASEQAYRVRE